MAFFGQEFIDVFAALGLTRTAETPTIDLDEVTLRILHAEIELRLNRALPVRGVVVYFPPAIYRVHPGATRVDTLWEGDLTLPPGAVAWFESGARLQLIGAARVVLNDDVVAELETIFEEGPGGMVILGGKLPGVHPEWWGATGERSHDDADAIQRAIDAATARRQPYTPTSPTTQFRRSLPVLFWRNYHVARELVLGRVLGVPLGEPGAPTPEIGFGRAGLVATTLRGLVAGPGAQSTGLTGIAVSGGTFDGQALLTLQSTTGSAVDGLAFNADRLVDCCLSIESSPEHASGQSIAVSGCFFRGAKSVQLRTGPESRPERFVTFSNHDTGEILYQGYADPGGLAAVQVDVEVPVERAPFAGGDLVGLLIQRCDFEIDVPDGVPRGIEIRAGNLCPGRIVDCRFRGRASTFVDAISGMALIEGCHFENAKTPEPRPAVVAVETAVGMGASRRVVRVSLGALGFEAPSASDVFLREDVFALPDPSRPPQGVASPAALAVVGCSSRSATFLDCVRPSTATAARPERSLLLLGNLHTPVTASAAQPAPSVRWGRPRRTPFEMHEFLSPQVPMNAEASLCLIGCSLATGVSVYMGSAQSTVLATVVPGRSQDLVVGFEEVRPGFRTPTFVFSLGVILMLFALLVGCERSAPSFIPPADVVEPSDIVRNIPDAAFTDDLRTAHDTVDAIEDETLDPSDASADAVLAEDAPGDGGLRFLTNLGPPRQMRRNCPAITDGDPSIPAPRLRFPGSTMRVTSRRPTLEWILPAGVTGARVDLCRDPCCAQPITAIDVTGSSVRPPEMLPPGVVFWRARGRAGDRVGREVSFTWEFGVRHRDTPADTAWGVIKDINGDGFDDVVTTMTSQWTDYALLRVYWGGSDMLNDSRMSDMRMPGVSTSIVIGDVNGDGRADVVADSAWGGTRTNHGALNVGYGGPEGLRYDGTAIRIQHRLLISASDFNGDGFSDVVVSGNVASDSDRQFLEIYYGGEDGLGSSGMSEIADPNPTPSAPWFGCPASPGDLDGDGFGELVVTDRGIRGERGGYGRVYVFRGTVGGVENRPSVMLPPVVARTFDTAFGQRVFSVGDINGDRIGDVMVGEYYYGTANVYYGDRANLLVMGQSIFTPEPQWSRAPGAMTFGASSGFASDRNGDGQAELLIGCSYCVDDTDAAMATRYGRMYLYRCAASELELIGTLYGPGDNHLGLYGGAVAGSQDLDGDGFDDLVVGDTESSTRGSPRGVLYVYRGSQQAIGGAPLMIFGRSLPADLYEGVGAELAAVVRLETRG